MDKTPGTTIKSCVWSDSTLSVIHYLATLAVRRVTLRFGCHDTPHTDADPATLLPFVRLLLVLATRFTAAARAQTLRRRKRAADVREDFLTRPSIFRNPGPARRTNYAVTGRCMCTVQFWFEKSLETLPVMLPSSLRLPFLFFSILYARTSWKNVYSITNSI